MARKDIYVSVDIEADGPIPGINSMLSIGAAAFERGDRLPLSTFEINIQPLVGATQDPDTMAWWARQAPGIWEHSTKDAVHAEEAMPRFAQWSRQLGGVPVMVVFPSWDFMWVHYYLRRFAGKELDPYGIGALDVKSLAFGLLPEFNNFRDTAKSRMPKHLMDGCPPHTHKALDDAIGQGVWLINLLELRSK